MKSIHFSSIISNIFFLSVFITLTFFSFVSISCSKIKTSDKSSPPHTRDTLSINSTPVVSTSINSEISDSKSPEFVYFTPNSFHDHYGESPMLKCRDKLVKIYSKEVDSVMNFNKQIILTGPRVMENLYKSDDSILKPGFNYFGLFEYSDSKHIWKKMELNPKITFNKFNYCDLEDEPTLSLDLDVVETVSPESLLIISGTPESVNGLDKDSAGYFQSQILKIDTIYDSIDINYGYLVPFRIINTKYTLPLNENNITRLFKVDSIKMPEGNDTINMSSSIWVVLKSNDTIKLFADHEHGNSNQAYSAYISNLYFLDANGDHLWDLCFDSYEGTSLCIQTPIGKFKTMYVFNNPEMLCD